MKKLVLLLGVILGLSLPVGASAAPKPQPPYWQWLSSSSIELVTGNRDNPYHMQNGVFVPVGGSCPYVVVNSNISSASMYTNQGSIDGACDVASNITLYNVGASGYKPFDPKTQNAPWPESWHWLSNGQLIYTNVSGGYEVAYQQDGNHFVKPGTTCPYVDVQASDPGSGVYHDGTNCANATNIAIFQTNDAKIGTHTTSTGSGGTGSDDVCTSSTASFAWLVCPLVTILQKDVIEPIYTNIITPLLTTQPIAGNAPLQAVWRAFLNIADIFFVIAFMVIIFGSALSLDIDAYTVKKALPRLVMAAIFIQFSYFVCEVIVDAGNILGHGLLDLIFTALHNAKVDTGGGVGWNGAIGAVGTGVIVGGAAIAGAIAGFSLLILLVGVVVSIVTFLITLVMRQMLIYMLVVLAPIAFVAWILPNTEKYFKMWYQNFIKLVMMYPLIALLLGAGYIMQAAVGHGEANGVAQLIAILAPTITFFMMPATFKMAGGVMGAAGGAIAKIGGRARKGAVEGTKGALDNSAKLKQRRADKRTDWINKAQGEGFGARYAQRRLGMGWASTPLAVNQINAMAAEEEKKRLEGASRQVRDLDRHQWRQLAQGKNLEIKDADGNTIKTIQATEDIQRASIDKLAQARDTDGLEEVQTALYQSGQQGLYDSALRSSSAYGAIYERAPHVASPTFKYSSTTSAAMSEFNATAMKRLLSDPKVTDAKKLELFSKLDERQRGLVRSRFTREMLQTKGEDGKVISDQFDQFSRLLAATEPTAVAPVGPGGAPLHVDDDGDTHL